MVSSTETSVEGYLASLPADRRDAIEAVRRVVRESLPTGYEEAMQYGMIGYGVPLSRYPDTYNGLPLTIAALASQKQHMALYLHCVYAEPELSRWFEARYRETGKKLDMGKSCLRFKRLDDLPLDVIGETIARVPVDDLIASYERARAAPPKKPAAKKKAPAKKKKAAPATKTAADTKPGTAKKKPAAKTKKK